MFDLSTLLFRVLRPRHRRLELAPTARVETHGRIVERILVGAAGFPLEDVWVSDGTRLTDFCLEEDLTEEWLRARVERMFDVDISHIEDGNLAEVAEHIAANSRRF